MKIYKVKSKSNPNINRFVRVKNGMHGEPIYECSCPANVWWRVSHGRSGKENCRHIQEVKAKVGLDNKTKQNYTKLRREVKT